MRLILIILLICCVSCKGNRPKDNERDLATENLTKETLPEQEAIAKELGLTKVSFLKSFKYEEVRQVDPNNPPEVIDIIGSRKTPSGKIKISQLFNNIEYVVIKQTPDSVRGEAVVSPNHVYILDNEKGIAQFNKQGEFIRYICKNFFPHTKHKQGYSINTEQYKMFYGATDIYWNEGRLYYKYEDRPEEKTYTILFDENSQDIQEPDLPDNNVKLKTGTVVSELIEVFGISNERRNSKLLGENILVSAQSSKVYIETKFLIVTSVSGDNICSFKDFDPIKDNNKSTTRNADFGDSYLLNGIFNIRQCYNDTVYSFSPPNRLTPKYIIDFGDMGIKSSDEGADIVIGLENKLIINKLFESDKYLFITYTKDYLCPNTIKSGSVKFSRLVYNKNSKNLMTISIDMAPDLEKTNGYPNPEVENDLDGMPFVWPIGLTYENKPYAYVPASEFSKIANRPERLKNIGENDYILIIYN